MTDQTNRPTENDGAVDRARQVLADAWPALARVDQMSRIELCALIGRLTGAMQGLLEYVDLTATIARCEQAVRESIAGVVADRGQVVSTAVTDDELETIKALADLTDLSVPEFLRQAALAAHGGHLSRIADLELRADRAERIVLEITHTVKRLTDGVQ